MYSSLTNQKLYILLSILCYFISSSNLDFIITSLHFNINLKKIAITINLQYPKNKLKICNLVKKYIGF